MKNSLAVSADKHKKTSVSAWALPLLLCLPGISAIGHAADTESHSSASGINANGFVSEPSHASQSADIELLQDFSQNPERYIGKNLQFTNGKLIGEIIDVRRRIEDLELYLVVDATPFFNDQTIYAINSKDVEYYQDQSVHMSMSKGMHLRGRIYYAEEYTASDNFMPEGYEIK